MGRHNPDSKTFIQKMERFEKILEQFLASPDFPELLIAHANHTRDWLYNHQTVWVRLLPDGTWNIHPLSLWSNGKDCLVLVYQVSYFRDHMKEIEEDRDFEDILNADSAEARSVVERLFAKQEEKIKLRTRSHFHYQRERGHMD